MELSNKRILGSKWKINSKIFTAILVEDSKWVQECRPDYHNKYNYSVALCDLQTDKLLNGNPFWCTWGGYYKSVTDQLSEMLSVSSEDEKIEYAGEDPEIASKYFDDDRFKLGSKWTHKNEIYTIVKFTDSKYGLRDDEPISKGSGLNPYWNYYSSIVDLKYYLESQNDWEYVNMDNVEIKADPETGLLYEDQRNNKDVSKTVDDFKIGDWVEIIARWQDSLHEIGEIVQITEILEGDRLMLSNKRWIYPNCVRRCDPPSSNKETTEEIKCPDKEPMMEVLTSAEPEETHNQTVGQAFDFVKNRNALRSEKLRRKLIVMDRRNLKELQAIRDGIKLPWNERLTITHYALIASIVTAIAGWIH